LGNLDDLIKSSDFIEVKTQPTYIDKFGVTWAVYEKGKSELQKCNSALSNPVSYLNDCGQYAAFDNEVRHRLATDQAHVQKMKIDHDIELGNPTSVKGKHGS
jgi:hypothetical protein